MYVSFNFFNKLDFSKIQDPWLKVGNYCSFFLAYPFHDLIWRFWFLKLFKISFIFYFFFYLKGSMKINKESRATKQPQNQAKSKRGSILGWSNGLELNIEWKISAKWSVLARFGSVLFHIKPKRNILNTIVFRLQYATTGYFRSTFRRWNRRSQCFPWTMIVQRLSSEWPPTLNWEELEWIVGDVNKAVEWCY